MSARKVAGLHTHRFRDNPEEQAFAEAWAKDNEFGSTLAHLLDEHATQRNRPLDPTDREKVVAATVIQWLGSPVGQCFLRDLGYEKAGKK